MKHAYTVGPLSESAWQGLLWAADRGYDGNIVELATAEDTENGMVLMLTEPEAWAFKEYVESDPDAFCACMGAEVVEALYGLLDSIV